MPGILQKNGFRTLRKVKHFIQLHFLSYFKNIYKTKFEHNVLVSYITSPLYRGIQSSHSNYIEFEIICRIFKELNFNVDVADYTCTRRIHYKRYHVILGFGFPYGKAFYDNNAIDSLKIGYLTGAMNLFDQIKRIKYLRERKGIGVVPRREYYYKYFQTSISLSEAIVCTGNEWTVSTITPYNNKVYGVGLPIHVDKIPKVDHRNWSSAKKNFLWFGSLGAVHKGLDILLDVFSTTRNVHLHICGPVNKEKDFAKLYEEELFRTSNIHFYGFVDIKSAKFKELAERCGFIIFPSCSEGSSGSVLTCMAAGLIPVVTNSAGVTVNDFGILLQDYKIEYLKEIISELLGLDNITSENMSKRAANYARTHHSPEAYRDNFVRALTDIISNSSLTVLEKGNQ